jgi:hypothetical protein
MFPLISDSGRATFAAEYLRRFRDDHCPLTWRKLTPMEINPPRV